MWVGTATAHELRGWRTLIFPVISTVVIVIVVVFSLSALLGTGMVLEGILEALGWVPKP